MGEIPLPDLSGDTFPDSLAAEDGAEADPDAVVTYCFIAEDTLLSEQAAREGEEIVRPDDPVAPEGFAFEGWYLEDGAPLFTDADGDGGIDPVIAHPDPFIRKSQRRLSTRRRPSLPPRAR